MGWYAVEIERALRKVAEIATVTYYVYSKPARMTKSLFAKRLRWNGCFVKVIFLIDS